MDKVVHFEIPADNPERARKFYKETFGWSVEKVPMPGMDYYMVQTVATGADQTPKEPGAINGGMMKRMVRGEGPIIVIGVPSLDAALKKVEKAGGKVVLPKQQVGDMGLYARFQDPEGNVVGLWQDLK